MAYTLLILKWRPASWQDIGSLPHPVVNDYFAMLSGQASAAKPWDWYRTGARGVATIAHLFRVGPSGPEPLARCGFVAAAKDDYRREDVPPLCQRCDAIASGQPLSVGTIGDLEDEMARGG
jgi:hypothetical protein